MIGRIKSFISPKLLNVGPGYRLVFSKLLKTASILLAIRSCRTYNRFTYVTGPEGLNTAIVAATLCRAIHSTAVNSFLLGCAQSCNTFQF
jgi:hypothetical protein